MHLDVKANAVAAAFRDSRFAPLTRDEIGSTTIDVSELSRPEPLEFADEADARDHLRVGIDGLIFEHGAGRSTFLPQVWEQLPKAEDFLRQLKRKEIGRGITLPAIPEIRAKTGLSQNGFARLLGVSVRTLQEWEQGRRVPSGPARMLLAIAYRNPKALLDAAA